MEYPLLILIDGQQNAYASLQTRLWGLHCYKFINSSYCYMKTFRLQSLFYRLFMCQLNQRIYELRAKPAVTQFQQRQQRVNYRQKHSVQLDLYYKYCKLLVYPTCKPVILIWLIFTMAYNYKYLNISTTSEFVMLMHVRTKSQNTSSVTAWLARSHRFFLSFFTILIIDNFRFIYVLLVLIIVSFIFQNLAPYFRYFLCEVKNKVMNQTKSGESPNTCYLIGWLPSKNSPASTHGSLLYNL